MTLKCWAPYFIGVKEGDSDLSRYWVEVRRRSSSGDGKSTSKGKK